VKITAYGRQTVSDRGVVRSRDPLQNFGGSNHITGTAESIVVKFCTRAGYVNSNNRMTYHQQKGRVYGHVTVLKFCHLSWCSASCGFVSDSWATCLVLVYLHLFNFYCCCCHCCTCNHIVVYLINMNIFYYSYSGQWKCHLGDLCLWDDLMCSPKSKYENVYFLCSILFVTKFSAMLWHCRSLDWVTGRWSTL